MDIVNRQYSNSVHYIRFNTQRTLQSIRMLFNRDAVVPKEDHLLFFI